ncbi:T9SS type A sorting domain-containing protein [Zobellia uliginosa]|uniref:T9SS type A sorting domain-containing protein n=1 Tax=Zobellia uliginosa TaxID=143224 RepID=UPI0026E17420|nr:T9SS type A sorting domain-containing protein [Zobellia uliginosa]MDO6517444.1 T9SS type A sorting domain-containing protein [Zobellia uliginosa]
MKTFVSFICLLLFICTAQAQDSTENNGRENTSITSTKKVKVFPNPASNVVNILGLENTAKAHISIMDIYGNTVLKYEWEIRRNAINIPIPSLDPGVYMVTVNSKEQKVRVKFYKQ